MPERASRLQKYHLNNLCTFLGNHWLSQDSTSSDLIFFFGVGPMKIIFVDHLCCLCSQKIIFHGSVLYEILCIKVCHLCYYWHSMSKSLCCLHSGLALVQCQTSFHRAMEFPSMARPCRHLTAVKRSISIRGYVSSRAAIMDHA